MGKLSPRRLTRLTWHKPLQRLPTLGHASSAARGREEVTNRAVSSSPTSTLETVASLFRIPSGVGNRTRSRAETRSGRCRRWHTLFASPQSALPPSFLEHFDPSTHLLGSGRERIEQVEESANACKLFNRQSACLIVSPARPQTRWHVKMPC
ncbi:unnamed protein product [Protopolystoma xenopodis]|uniref:Uncharacterized protein n=1 Tax=Protopolystoma xenopodis TaxID=117903 RepID=A0A3S5FHG6_9PLAT|nr:unnamed protein product [Protopolystoma xenopodis]